MAQVTFGVQGMTCEHCVRAVTEAVAGLPGTGRVDVDLTAGSLTYESAGPVDRDVLEAAVEEAGYTLGPPIP